MPNEGTPPHRHSGAAALSRPVPAHAARRGRPSTKVGTKGIGSVAAEGSHRASLRSGAASRQFGSAEAPHGVKTRRTADTLSQIHLYDAARPEVGVARSRDAQDRSAPRAVEHSLGCSEHRRAAVHERHGLPFAEDALGCSCVAADSPTEEPVWLSCFAIICTIALLLFPHEAMRLLGDLWGSL